MKHIYILFSSLRLLSCVCLCLSVCALLKGFWVVSLMRPCLEHSGNLASLMPPFLLLSHMTLGFIIVQYSWSIFLLDGTNILLLPLPSSVDLFKQLHYATTLVKFFSPTKYIKKVKFQRGI